MAAVAIDCAFHAEASLNTNFTESADGVRIAYDRIGKGPAVVLIHGGGSNRQVWHDIGYVDRLKDHFTVITLDLRGHGESDLPTEVGDYTPEKLCADILGVSNACGFEYFSI